eukprot:4045542-Pyramimonas_sp.AAC.1
MDAAGLGGFRLGLEGFRLGLGGFSVGYRREGLVLGLGGFMLGLGGFRLGLGGFRREGLGWCGRGVHYTLLRFAMLRYAWLSGWAESRPAGVFYVSAAVALVCTVSYCAVLYCATLYCSATCSPGKGAVAAPRAGKKPGILYCTERAI